MRLEVVLLFAMESTACPIQLDFSFLSWHGAKYSIEQSISCIRFIWPESFFFFVSAVDRVFPDKRSILLIFLGSSSLCEHSYLCDRERSAATGGFFQLRG
jgi:hypothetical protein